MACMINGHVVTMGRGIPLALSSVVEGESCDCGKFVVKGGVLVAITDGQLKGR